MNQSEVNTSTEQVDQLDSGSEVMQFNRDQLFTALRFAIPGATHDQLLALVRALDSFVSAKALEVASL